MIISASRRTDIPAFYFDWFLNRLKEKYVLVKNPFNRKQISRISLSPEDVDAFVFWTKNPEPILKKIEEINEYSYYFQFTLNFYDKTIERNLPKINEKINTFKKLSQKTGSNKIIWRYDPIFFHEGLELKEHLKNFKYIAEKLSTYTQRCTISLLDNYNKCQNNMKEIKYRIPQINEIKDFASQISPIAKNTGITIVTCASKINLSEFEIHKGSCIDKELISKISGEKTQYKLDKNQRKYCQCTQSIDIGTYNTCIHGCKYCYANNDHQKAFNNYENYNKDSPILCSNLNGDEVIKYKNNSEKDTDRQLRLF